MGLMDKLLGGNVLYFPGCLTNYVFKDLKENYEKILKICGIRFIELGDIVCCGSPVKNAGYMNIFKDLARKNFKLFQKYHIKKIITNCPACYHVLAYEYPKVLGKKLEVEHASISIFKVLNKLKLTELKLRAVYHDPCHLGRYSGIYEEPRKILKAMGIELVEFEFNMENSFCCGGGGGVSANYPDLAEAMARERINQAKEIGVKNVITCCPLCYANLMKGAQDTDVKVIELSQLLIKAIKV